MKEKVSFLPTVTLDFKKGDLIAKQGDYGISVYQIIEGKVGIFVHSNGDETILETLGPGEIIGEMVFLSGYAATRSASIRALEPSVLEAWHPSRIKKEYDEMPFVIRQMANQMVDHLKKVDRMISKRTLRAPKKKEKSAAAPRASRKPRAYRKTVHMDCRYRPAEEDEKVRLWGRVKNISRSGLRIDVMRMNALDYSHAVGDEFVGTVYAGNGKQLDIRFRIANTQLYEKDRILSLGVQIVEVDRNSKTDLGFLLLA
jgi:CRP-like cAMP-binding protein